ncbi:10358_t:CDS:1, partial [Paraglomus brasilianum]
MNGLSSLLDFHKISNPTWQGRGLKSQIDDIWVSSNILLDIDTPDLIIATGISDSDH